MRTLFIILIFICIAAVLNLLVKKYAFKNLNYSRQVDRNRCFPNEAVTLSVHVTNKKILPLSYVEITEVMPEYCKYLRSDGTQTAAGSKAQEDEDIMGGLYYHKSSMMLLPYQRITRKYNINYNHRGRYYLHTVTIKTGDLFGLDSYFRDYESPLEILIYPAIKPLCNIVVDYRNPMGDVSVKRWIIEDPNIISGIREYTLSDPFNKIHWPSSARHTSLMVKSFDFTADRSAMILLNIETSRPFWQAIYDWKIECAVEAAASVADELLKTGMPCGLATNASLSGYFSNEGNYLQPSCRPNYLSNILDTLARITYSIQYQFENILTEILKSYRTGTKYIIITPIIVEEIAAPLNLLAEQTDVMLITFPDQDISKISEKAAILMLKEGSEYVEAV